MMRGWPTGFLALLLSPTLVGATKPGGAFVSLQHAGCESRCAVYTLTIPSNGRAVYEGRYYVRKTGIVVVPLPPAEVRAVFAKVAALDLEQLKQVYRQDAGDCEQWAEDRPTSTLTIDVSGISKIVTYNLGCVGPVTSRLAELEREMTRAVKIERWIK